MFELNDVRNLYQFAQQSLSRQSSLAEDRINSSDEDEFLEERSGGTYTLTKHHSLAVRPNSFPQARACKHNTFVKQCTSSLSLENNQPDLIKEVLRKSLKPSQTENDLQKLEREQFDKASSTESFCSFRSKKFLTSRSTKSESFARVGDESKIKKKRQKNLLSRSCITQ